MSASKRNRTIYPHVNFLYTEGTVLNGLHNLHSLQNPRWRLYFYAKNTALASITILRFITELFALVAPSDRRCQSTSTLDI